MRLSEELTKAVINGYYRKDFDGWNTVRDEGDSGMRPYDDNSLHLGYGITIECYTPGDKCTVCLIQDCEGGGYVSLAIEDCDVTVDDEKVTVSSTDKDCRIEILHDPLPQGYIEEHCGKRLKRGKTKKRGSIFDRFRSEYVGLPKYEERLASMSDETLDMLIRYFKLGEEDAVPWETKEGNTECTIGLMAGHSLRMIRIPAEKKSEGPKAKQTTSFSVADNKKEERNNRHELTWSSPDGTHKLCSETDFFGIWEGEMQTGCRWSETCYRIGDRLKERLKAAEKASGR